LTVHVGAGLCTEHDPRDAGCPGDRPGGAR